jgi:hypothetical protein
VTTTTAPVASVPLELRVDGLGPVHFGEPIADVVAALSARLGPPDSDGGVDGCAGHHRRVVWGDLWIDASPLPDERLEAYWYGSANMQAPYLPPTGVAPVITAPGGVGFATTTASSDAFVSRLRSAYGIEPQVVPTGDPSNPTVIVRLVGGGGKLDWYIVPAGDGFTPMGIGGNRFDPANPDPYGCS